MSKYLNICNDSEFTVLIQQVKNCISVKNNDFHSRNQQLKELLEKMNNINYNLDKHHNFLLNNKVYKDYTNQLPLIEYNNYKLFNLVNRNPIYNDINIVNTSLKARGHKELSRNLLNNKNSKINEKNLDKIFREIQDFSFNSQPPLKCENILKEHEDLIEIVFNNLRNSVINTDFKKILIRLQTKIQNFLIKTDGKKSPMHNINYHNLLILLLIKEFNFLKKYGIIDLLSLFDYDKKTSESSINVTDGECCWWAKPKNKHDVTHGKPLSKIEVKNEIYDFDVLSEYNYENNDLIDILLKEKKGANIYMKYLDQNFSNKFVFHKFLDKYSNNELVLEIVKCDAFNKKLNKLILDINEIYYKTKEHYELQRFPNFNKLSDIKYNHIINSDKKYKELNENFNNLLKMNNDHIDLNESKKNSLKGKLEHNFNNILDFSFSKTEEKVIIKKKIDKNVYNFNNSDFENFKIFYRRQDLNKKSVSELIEIYEKLFEGTFDTKAYTKSENSKKIIIDKILSYKKKFSLFNFEYNTDNSVLENCNIDIIKKRFYLDILTIDLLLFRNIKLVIKLIFITLDLWDIIFKLQQINVEDFNITNTSKGEINIEEIYIKLIKKQKKLLERNEKINDLKDEIQNNISKINSATNFNEIYTKINVFKEDIKYKIEHNIILKLNLLKNFFE